MFKRLLKRLGFDGQGADHALTKDELQEQQGDHMRGTNLSQLGPRYRDSWRLIRRRGTAKEVRRSPSPGPAFARLMMKKIRCLLGFHNWKTL